MCDQVYKHQIWKTNKSIINLSLGVSACVIMSVCQCRDTVRAHHLEAPEYWCWKGQHLSRKMLYDVRAWKLSC